MLKIASYLILIAMGLFVETILIINIGLQGGLIGVMGCFLFTGWCLLPYTLLASCIYKQKIIEPLIIVYFIGIIIISYGIYKYIYELFVNPGAQSSLVYIYVPFIQLLGYGLIKVILLLYKYILCASHRK